MVPVTEGGTRYSSCAVRRRQDDTMMDELKARCGHPHASRALTAWRLQEPSGELEGTLMPFLESVHLSAAKDPPLRD